MSSRLSSFAFSGPTPRGEALDQPLLLPPVVDTGLSGPNTNVHPVDVVTGVVDAGTAGTAALGWAALGTLLTEMLPVFLL